MKLISNFKDSWDYIIGQRGIDEKVIYNRICFTKYGKEWVKAGLYKPSFITAPKINKFARYSIAFCGNIYEYYHYDGKGYYQWSAHKIRDLLPEDNAPIGLYHTSNSIRKLLPRKNDAFHKIVFPTNINDLQDSPVVLLKGDVSGFRIVAKEIRLEDFNFLKVMSADKVYDSIYNFISREKKVIDTRTDEEKIESHGFDKKQSFRHRKNK